MEERHKKTGLNVAANEGKREEAMLVYKGREIRDR